jgi:predicted MPP superfamily phosphohydrolase
MKFIVMILTMLVLMLGISYYVFYRLYHLIPTFPANKIIFICIAIFLFVSPFIAMGLGYHFPYSIASFFYKLGTSWMFILMYLVLIFCISDLLRLTCLPPLKQYMFNSWTGAAALLIFITILMTSGYVNYLNKKRVELTFNLDKITQSDNQIKIVAISDLHLGYGISPKEFRKWVPVINKEEADVLLIAGDAIDSSIKPLLEKNYAEVFGEIKTKFGIFMIPGNHEYIAGINKCVDFLTNAGIILLQDSSVLVNNQFYIVGRDDKKKKKRKQLSELTDSLDKSKPIILLDHQPYNLDKVAENNIDLQISGHTHAGQIFPITLITKAMYELSYGYMKKENSNIYVTSGIGLWGGKFRIGSCSELVIIKIKSK